MIYFYYRGSGRKIQLASYVKTKSLNLGTVRSALKEAGVYPGPSYSEAVYHSFNTLDFFEKISE